MALNRIRGALDRRGVHRRQDANRRNLDYDSGDSTTINTKF